MQFVILAVAATLLAASATAMPGSNNTNSSTPDAPTAVGPVKLTFDICSDAVLELADAAGSKIGYTHATIIPRNENQVVMEAVPSDAGHDGDIAVPSPDAVSPKLRARQSDETPSYNVDLNEWLLAATLSACFLTSVLSVDVPEAAGEDAGDNQG
ncbi:hypothetical protein LTR27_010512 [Elasticomyces elasticus]|nr:hypothetical protein LTR27_010512 [Elasticomyces elasticus]